MSEPWAHSPSSLSPGWRGAGQGRGLAAWDSLRSRDPGPGFQLLSQRAHPGLGKGPEKAIRVTSKVQCFLDAKKSLSRRTDGWRVEAAEGSGAQGRTPCSEGSHGHVEAGAGQGGCREDVPRALAFSQEWGRCSGPVSRLPVWCCTHLIRGSGRLLLALLRGGRSGPRLPELEPGFPQAHQPLSPHLPEQTVWETPTCSPFPLLPHPSPAFCQASPARQLALLATPLPQALLPLPRLPGCAPPRPTP